MKDKRTVIPQEASVQSPPLDPPVDDLAPTVTVLTGYDEDHLVTYLRLLDAEAAGADWREVAKTVLRIDPATEPERAHRVWKSHLRRARWMTEHGYRQLLQGGAPH
jgi:predicted secreted protein